MIYLFKYLFFIYLFFVYLMEFYYLAVNISCNSIFKFITSALVLRNLVTRKIFAN